MSEVIYVGAQRRITLTFKVEGERKPKHFTFWPPNTEHPRRPNKCPADIWTHCMGKKQSPRFDQGEQYSPLEEYLEKGILWTLTPQQANAVNEGKMPNVSPHGPMSSAVRPQPREAGQVEGLKHIGSIDSVSSETMQVDMPAQ